MNYFLKKIAVALIVILLVYQFTPSAKAQLLVSDPAVFTVVSTIAGQGIAERVKEDLLDGLAWTFAKVAIQSMTRSIVNWINSGYEGEPAFSQNLTRDLRQAGDAVAGAFITDFFEANIDSPFLSLARDTVSVYYLLTSEDALAQRLKYSLGSFAQRSTDYIRGDWSGGGLSGWYGLTFRCENDPNCSSFLVHEALAQRIDAQSRKFIAEFNAGRGFLSWKGECSLYESQTDNSAAFQRCVADNEANGTNNDCFALYGNMGTSLGDEDTCAEYDVMTPGAVVEESLSEALGSPIKQLELADSINEIVAAVVTQMVNQVLGGGGLAGLSTPRASGNTSPINQATNPNTSGTSITGGFAAQVNRELTKATEYRNAWADIQTVAIAAQDACPSAGGTVSIFRSQQIQDAVNRSGAAVTRADSVITELQRILLLIEAVGDGELGGAGVASSQRAYEVYQNLLSSGRLITDGDNAEAQSERNEDSSESLYSEMQGYVNACD